jgi:hypothetical protein
MDSLTIEELIDVQLATKGERRLHRHWPPDVVEKFCAAPLAADAGPAGRPARLLNFFRRILPSAPAPSRPSA